MAVGCREWAPCPGPTVDHLAFQRTNCDLGVSKRDERYDIGFFANFRAALGQNAAPPEFLNSKGCEGCSFTNLALSLWICVGESIFKKDCEHLHVVRLLYGCFLWVHQMEMAYPFFAMRVVWQRTHKAMAWRPGDGNANWTGLGGKQPWHPLSLSQVGIHVLIFFFPKSSWKTLERPVKAGAFCPMACQLRQDAPTSPTLQVHVFTRNPFLDHLSEQILWTSQNNDMLLLTLGNASKMSKKSGKNCWWMT